MKAVVCYGKHDWRLEEKPTPTPRVGEVLVQVMACGICGTDVHIYEGDEGCAKTPAGTVPGHEFSGVVAAVGEGVESVHVGDRVCVDPNRLCGSCYYCRRALGHFCEHMTGYGTTTDGGFAEYCAVPVSQVYPIADTTSFDRAAMSEPVSCCLHGIDQCDIRTDDTVAVIGCGMIGLLMLQLAKAAGAKTLIAIEPQEEKRRLAASLGADLCIDPLHEDTASVIAAHGICRVSKVLECAGRVSTMEQAVALAGKRSTVVFFGLTAPGETVNLKPFDLFKREIEIKSSYINPYTMGRAVEMIDSGRLDVSSMIYKTASLSDLPAILADRDLRRRGKFIIHPNGKKA